MKKIDPSAVADHAAGSQPCMAAKVTVHAQKQQGGEEINNYQRDEDAHTTFEICTANILGYLEHALPRCNFYPPAIKGCILPSARLLIDMLLKEAQFLFSCSAEIRRVYCYHFAQPPPPDAVSFRSESRSSPDRRMASPHILPCVSPPSG